MDNPEKTKEISEFIKEMNGSYYNNNNVRDNDRRNNFEKISKKIDVPRSLNKGSDDKSQNFINDRKDENKLTNKEKDIKPNERGGIRVNKWYYKLITYKDCGCTFSNWSTADVEKLKNLIKKYNSFEDNYNKKIYEEMLFYTSESYRDFKLHNELMELIKIDKSLPIAYNESASYNVIERLREDIYKGGAIYNIDIYLNLSNPDGKITEKIKNYLSGFMESRPKEENTFLLLREIFDDKIDYVIDEAIKNYIYSHDNKILENNEELFTQIVERVNNYYERLNEITEAERFNFDFNFKYKDSLENAIKTRFNEIKLTELFGPFRKYSLLPDGDFDGVTLNFHPIRDYVINAMRQEGYTEEDIEKYRKDSFRTPENTFTISANILKDCNLREQRRLESKIEILKKLEGIVDKISNLDKEEMSTYKENIDNCLEEINLNSHNGISPSVNEINIVDKINILSDLMDYTNSKGDILNLFYYYNLFIDSVAKKIFTDENEELYAKTEGDKADNKTEVEENDMQEKKSIENKEPIGHVDALKMTKISAFEEQNCNER